MNYWIDGFINSFYQHPVPSTVPLQTLTDEVFKILKIRIYDS
jgi:hypothetical protein